MLYVDDLYVDYDKKKYTDHICLTILSAKLTRQRTQYLLKNQS